MWLAACDEVAEELVTTNTYCTKHGWGKTDRTRWQGRVHHKWLAGRWGWERGARKHARPLVWPAAPTPRSKKIDEPREQTPPKNLKSPTTQGLGISLRCDLRDPTRKRTGLSPSSHLLKSIEASGKTRSVRFSSVSESKREVFDAWCGKSAKANNFRRGAPYIRGMPKKKKSSSAAPRFGFFPGSVALQLSITPVLERTVKVGLTTWVHLPTHSLPER